MRPTPPFFDLDPNELRGILADLSMPAFRAKQLLQWVYEKSVTDSAQMTNLSKADREKLSSAIRFHTLKPTQHQSATDGTQKLLLELTDSESPANPTTECVMIPAENQSGGTRRTACISSQVGCPVGCRFCASGLGGLEKNLSAGQIVEQVYHLNQLPEVRGKDDTGRITNIVFMGMGEPLTNFQNVVKAVRTLTADWAFNISARRITVSTVGLPAQIKRLAEIDLPITLALSLHAPNDELRRQLIPWAEHTTIEALINACRIYFDQTGREITLEYILLGNVNDRPQHARQLATVAKQLRCNVNLIRYNEVASLPYNRPSTDGVHKFQKILQEAGINAHIRASRGRDIAAACGQLRHEQKAAAT